MFFLYCNSLVSECENGLFCHYTVFDCESTRPDGGSI